MYDDLLLLTVEGATGFDFLLKLLQREIFKMFEKKAENEKECCLRYSLLSWMD